MCEVLAPHANLFALRTQQGFNAFQTVYARVRTFPAALAPVAFPVLVYASIAWWPDYASHPVLSEHHQPALLSNHALLLLALAAVLTAPLQAFYSGFENR